MDHPCSKIIPSLDRFRESHFWIHQMEGYYHEADQFRWHLNAFLKALKEVSQLLLMDLDRSKLDQAPEETGRSKNC